MRNLRATGAAAAILTASMSVSGAFAQDLSVVEPAPPASYWDEFYTGILGTAVTTGGSTEFGLAGVIGLDIDFGSVVLGAEAELLALNSAGGAATQGQLLARAGVEVTPDLLVFAAGGVGADFSGTGDRFGVFGGGVEIDFSESLSFRGQYLYGEGLGGAADQQQVSFGALFNF